MAHATRATHREWGISSVVDEENKQFVVTIPFAPDELPYYPVLVAAIIACRSSTTMYNAVSRNLYGISEQAAEIDGVAHVHHDSLVQYMALRDASAEEILARKRSTLQRIATRKVRPRRRPDKPIPVTATRTAEELLASGVMDFLNTLKGVADDTDTD
ncbi:MAG: hypothetical protein ACYTFQ_20625 [Planctomycetota bacterium]|jgi:hypothetical protein